MTFTPYPKIPRLFRDVVITEKIDGTNASIAILPIDDYACIANPSGYPSENVLANDNAQFVMLAGSRTRWLTPDKKGDNMGFATWVQANAAALFRLGPGQHFGEWWGNGIQRTYGLPNGDKRFSLFNTFRWEQLPEGLPANVGIVPVLYQGPFGTDIVRQVVDHLATEGSRAVPGFARPEGVMVYHEASKQIFKVTVEDDEKPKGQKD